jgi:hypothetical protein
MSDYVPCPKCNSAQIEKVSYTPWGGMLDLPAAGVTASR